MPVPAVEGLTAFEEIGRGGFGVVYRAHQESLGRDIAVKVLPGVHKDSEAFARFERECKALGSVGAHPNIATVYGCGVTTDGEGFLAMELLDGGSLADRIAAVNLYLDESKDRRRRQLDGYRAEYGTCRPDGPFEVENALRGQWTMRCDRGALRVAITLAPTMPPKVQYLNVQPAPATSATRGCGS